MTDNGVFCILPWVHLHVWPGGNIYPCCGSMPEHRVGSTHEGTLARAWNGESMRALRLRMLEGEKSPHCQRCYEVEASGGGSLRGYANGLFAERHQGRVQQTDPCGNAGDLHMPYMDIRFSNICNFRCRNCGPDLSSGWFSDHDALYGGAGLPRKPLHAAADPEELWRQIEPLIPHLEEIYFAGGEPLLTEEHFRILSLLIEKKLFHVRLRYSTNFSKLSFAGQDFLPIWDKFESVTVWASLDASGKRAEYLRKGQRWDQVLRNRARLKESCPRVAFAVQATLSLANALHLPDFHRELTDTGFIGAHEFHWGHLFTPKYYQIQVLPRGLKDRVREKFEAHIEQFLGPIGPSVSHLGDAYRAALNFMESADLSGELEQFRSLTRRLDQIRGESFTEVFPELAELFS